MNRKLLIAVVASAATFFALPGFSASTYLVDFGHANTATKTGASPNDPVNSWNNITLAIGQSNSGRLENMITTDGAATGVSLQMVSRFNSDNGNGTLSSAIYPSNATRDSLFGNTSVFNGLSNIYPAFKLTNLDPNSLYSFTFYASRMGVTDNRETQYDVVGANSGVAWLDAANNLDNTSTVAGIAPDANGEILISLTPGPNNNNANTHFTYLGVLQIDTRVVPEPATGVLALVGLALAVRRRRA